MYFNSQNIFNKLLIILNNYRYLQLNYNYIISQIIVCFGLIIMIDYLVELGFQCLTCCKCFISEITEIYFS